MIKKIAMSQGENRTVTATSSELFAAALRTRLGARKFELWFQPGSLKVEAESVEVTAHSAFAAQWITNQFMGELNSSAAAVLGGQPLVTVVIEQPRDSTASEPISTQDAPSVSSPQQDLPRPSSRQTSNARRNSAAHIGDGEDAWRRFDDFITGSSNRLAFESARQIAEADTEMSRLLFLHGTCGVGKTHLLQSICRRTRERTPSARIRYTTAEQFTNDYIAAIRDGSIEGFRRKTRKLDLLAIDDIHFLANKSATQSECLHTIDAIGLGGCKVALASDAHPRQIAKFSAPLVSRFLSGMVVKVEEPDRATRLELARRLSARRGLALSQGALEAIVERAGANVRELEGAVLTVAALSAITPGNDNGRVLVEQALGGKSASPAGRPVRIGEIIAAVCATTGIEREDLVGHGRHRRSVIARGLATHLARELTTMSFPEIAQALGRSTHSTVHAAAARFRELVDANEECDARSERVSAADLRERTRREILRVRS